MASTPSNAFDTDLPSIRQVQGFIREKTSIEVKLMTGDTLAGLVSWQDANAICVKGDGGENTILMRGAIAYVKVH
ncbi:MAG: RNA-binding protein hfq [Cyanobacteria bacterium J06598_1]